MAEAEPGVDIERPFAPLMPDDAGNLCIPTRYCILTGGRGSGKSFALATGLAAAIQDPGYTVLYTRWTMASARDSIIPEFREKIERLGIRGTTEGVADIHHVGGSRILFRGIKTSQGTQTAKLKSLQGVNVWVLDEAEEMPSEAVFDVIDLSIRDSRRPCHVILSLNPALRTHWIYRRWFAGSSVQPGTCGVDLDRGVTYIHTDYRDNIRNLPADFVKIASECKAGNSLRYQHVWLGQWVDQREGALWTWESVNDSRKGLDEVPDMARVIVAVDPAVTNRATSDETGIIVAGKGIDGRFYILADESGRIPPLDWAQRAVDAYHKHRADGIVAEVNQGGDLVENTIRQVDRKVPYTAVRASRGKVTRAEPIAALYAQGRVSHVGTFRDLEAEMMTYCGYDSDASPNRIDACVYALSELAGIDQVASSPAIQSAAPNAKR
uniref:Putative terminase n=1 Tax=viral metagenome TaxID=1070528 RepID=A0A6M3L7B9_9ZZZZ